MTRYLNKNSTDEEISNAISHYFKDVDNEFTKLNRITDESYKYRGTDVLVQNTWELPLVIQFPNSSIDFKFSTSPGLFAT